MTPETEPTAPKISREACEELLRQGRPIAGHDLSDVDFVDLPLEGAIFDKCTARGLRFRSTNLDRSVIRECQLIDCVFSGGSLNEALFENCQLSNAERNGGTKFRFCQMPSSKFLHCDLTFSAFNGCNLFDVHMKECRLIGASFSKSSFAKQYSKRHIASRATFETCNLEYADLSETTLEKCRFVECRLRYADLKNTDLNNSVMLSCDFTEANLHGTDLSGADLRGSDLTGLNLTQLRSFQGMIVRQDQLYDLVSEIGVIVKSE